MCNGLTGPMKLLSQCSSSYIRGNYHYMRAGEQCSILLTKLPNDSAMADLAVTTAATNLTGFLNIFKGQMSTESPTDQISRYLRPAV